MNTETPLDHTESLVFHADYHPLRQRPVPGFLRLLMWISRFSALAVSTDRRCPVNCMGLPIQLTGGGQLPSGAQPSRGRGGANGAAPRGRCTAPTPTAPGCCPYTSSLEWKPPPDGRLIYNVRWMDSHYCTCRAKFTRAFRHSIAHPGS